MTPREFEQFVAQHYREKGYDVETTPYSGDYGVDVIAQKGEERIAIQVKMYGNSARKSKPRDGYAIVWRDGL